MFDKVQVLMWHSASMRYDNKCDLKKNPLETQNEALLHW